MKKRERERQKGKCVVKRKFEYAGASMDTYHGNYLVELGLDIEAM